MSTGQVAKNCQKLFMFILAQMRTVVKNNIFVPKLVSPLRQVAKKAAPPKSSAATPALYIFIISPRTCHIKCTLKGMVMLFHR